MAERVHQKGSCVLDLFSNFDVPREMKFLSLVIFGVKNTYNGVAKVLRRGMRERRLPEIFIKWTDVFCSNMEALHLC